MGSLTAYLQDTAGAAQVRSVPLTGLSAIDISEDLVYISLLELEHELLATISQSNLDRLRSITNIAKHLLWLTGANALQEVNPDLTLSSGLSRTLMLEQPSLNLCVLDVGSPESLLTDTRLHC
jgi:hypothetical protein